MTDRERIHRWLDVIEWAENAPVERRHRQTVDAIIQGRRRFIFAPTTGVLERVLVMDETAGPMTASDIATYRAIRAYRIAHHQAPLAQELAAMLDLPIPTMLGRLARLRELRIITAIRGSRRSLRVINTRQ